MKNLLLVISSLLLLACGGDPNRPMTYSDIRRMDSLVLQNKKYWQEYYDSTCVVFQDSLVNYYFDSLLQVEYDAIKKLQE